MNTCHYVLIFCIFTALHAANNPGLNDRLADAKAASSLASHVISGLPLFILSTQGNSPTNPNRNVAADIQRWEAAQQQVRIAQAHFHYETETKNPQ